MTTSAYLALALMEEVFTTTELVMSGVRSVLKIGNQEISYTPRSDQTISPDRTIEVFADRQPSNDNIAPQPKLRRIKGPKWYMSRYNQYMQEHNPHLSITSLKIEQSKIDDMPLAPNSHADDAPSAPKSFSIAGRPIWEAQMQHMQPRPQCVRKYNIDV